MCGRKVGKKLFTCKLFLLGEWVIKMSLQKNGVQTCAKYCYLQCSKYVLVLKKLVICQVGYCYRFNDARKHCSKLKDTMLPTH